MKNKVVGIVLASLMCLGLVAVPAQKASAASGTRYQYCPGCHQTTRQTQDHHGGWNCTNCYYQFPL